MPTTIELDVTELNAFSERVGNTARAMPNILLNEGLRKLGKLIVPTTGTGPLADETPKDTWKLARSTVFQIIGGAFRQVLEIRQAAKSDDGIYYGFIVREGSGLWGPTGQPITAKNAKFLHFFIGAEEFFRKSVKGQPPNPYHRRVLARLMPNIQRIVNEMGQKILAHISGEGTL